MNTPLPSVFRNSIFSTQKKDYIQNSVFNFSILREMKTDGFQARNSDYGTGKLFVEECEERILNSESSNPLSNLKHRCLVNIEDLKTNFTMKSVNYDMRVSFIKKECSNNNLNTVKRNLIPNLNDNMDIKCFLTTERKSKTISKYNHILSERKPLKINENVEGLDLNQKLDYILNSKKKKKRHQQETKEKLLKKKRKNSKF